MSLAHKGYQHKARCSECSQSFEEELPALAFGEPVYWNYRDKTDKSHLDSDFCIVVLNGVTHYFIRAVLRIPITDTSRYLEWGVWVSQKDTNFEKYQTLFKELKKPRGQPYFGWLSNSLPGYDETIGLEASVNFYKNGLRPTLTLDHDNKHQLCVDQHNGIAMQHAHELIHQALN